MLNCHPCIRQCIRLLIQDVLATSSSRSLNLPSRHPSVGSPSWLGRSYASTSTVVRRVSFSQDDPRSRKPNSSKEQGPTTVKRPDSPRKKRATAASEVFSTTSLERELRFLGDPLKLADHIRYLLKKDEHEKAAELVKMSSKSIGCTVSWNHLIDYTLHHGKVQHAMNLYNDMKKRAQLPDAQTFTILFRGLSWHPEYKRTLERTLSLYQSMNAPNCPVKPSIIHHNVVLRVCARCGDMDALFGVAAKLPSHGPGAPDQVTFTTILNAIHREAWPGGGEGDDPKVNVEQRQRANMQGRRLWGEIIGRVQKGDLRIDEHLVGAMGRILLLGGSENDCQDVLSLVEQTMGIKRPLARPDAHDPALDAPKEAETTDLASHEPVSSPKSVSTWREFPDDEMPGGEFNPLPNSKSKPFAVPGQITLSLVVDACIRLRAVTWAQSYWGVLTDDAGPYKVVPDAQSYHMYLRLLRLQRASKQAVELVTQMLRGIDGSAPIALEPKTFRIAMSACVRDSKNPNVRENADKLAKIMSNTLEAPDIKTLEMYLKVASNRTNQDWKSMMRMLRETVLMVGKSRSLLAYRPNSDQGVGRNRGNGPNRRLDPTQGLDPKKDLDPSAVTGLVTRLISAYDVAMSVAGEAMDQEDRADYVKYKKILTAWVTRSHQIQMQIKLRNEPNTTPSKTWSRGISPSMTSSKTPSTTPSTDARPSEPVTSSPRDLESGI